MFFPNPAEQYYFCGNAISATAAGETATNIDFKVTDTPIKMSGAELLVQNGTVGDWIMCQVVDKDNVLGYGVNTVLNTFVTKWFIDPNRHNQLDLAYGALVPKDTYVRIQYNNTGSTAATVYLNFYLHKKS